MMKKITEGTKIKILGTGFNPDRIGIYIGTNSYGQLIINLDLYGFLPDNEKIIYVNQDEPFELV